MSYKADRYNKKYHDDCYGMKKHHNECGCPEKDNRCEKCDCCCVQGIKCALEDAKRNTTRNVAIALAGTPTTFFAGRIADLDCDTVTLTGASPAPTLPTLTGATFITLAAGTSITYSLCEVAAVLPL